VAAFFNGDIRTPSGGNSIQYSAGRNLYYILLNIGFTELETGVLNFTIKYMDTITGVIYVCTPTYSTIAGGRPGSLDNPILFTLGTTQTITITPGWKWISFYVNLSNTILNDTSLNNVADDTILIKAKFGDPAASFYNNEYGWEPESLDPDVWKNGISYQLNNSTNNIGTLSLTNDIPTSIDLTISPGWNWVGFINTTEKLITDIIPIGKTGYFIKRKEGDPAASVYSDEFGWEPLEFQIIPGEGYQFYLDETIFNDNEIINIIN
jgi:hypothetical protein